MKLLSYINLIPNLLLIIITFIMYFFIGNTDFPEAAIVLLIAVYPIASLIQGILIAHFNKNIMLSILFEFITFTVIFILFYPQKLYVYVIIYLILHVISYYFKKISS